MLVAALLVGLVGLVGCAAPTSSAPTAGSAPTSGSSPELRGSITVSAASSLTAPFTAIAAGFRAANPGVTDVMLNFDSSSTLVKQIEGGAPADVFAAADDASMIKLAEGGALAANPAPFARNRLTIVVKKGNPLGIATVADLAKAKVVALCGAEVPCGRYADQMLAKAGVSLPVERVTRSQNAKATLNAVAESDADAGIVYFTDVSGDRAEAVVVPDADNVMATYPIAVLRTSGNASVAEAFVAYVAGPAGQAELVSARFLPPG